MMHLTIPICRSANDQSLTADLFMLDCSGSPSSEGHILEDEFFEEHSGWMANLIYRFFDFCGF